MGVLERMRKIAEHRDGQNANVRSAKHARCPIICSGRGSLIIPAGTFIEHEEEKLE